MKLQPLFQFLLHPGASVSSYGGLTVHSGLGGGDMSPVHSPLYPGRPSVPPNLGFCTAALLAVGD